LHPETQVPVLPAICSPDSNALSFYCGCCGFCVLFESGLLPETGVTLAPFAVANSDALYLGVLMYPCTRFFSIRFTTTMAGCAPLSVWIQMGSYRFTCFLLSSLSSTISARSYFLCFVSALRNDSGNGPIRWNCFASSDQIPHNCVPRAFPVPPVLHASWRWTRSAHRALN